MFIVWVNNPSKLRQERHLIRMPPRWGIRTQLIHISINISPLRGTRNDYNHKIR